MKKRLEGKVAIITGGGSGQGRSSVLIFAEEGAKVVIAEWNDENGKAVEAEVKKAGGEATFIKTDVSSEDAVKAMVDATMKKYGKIDVLFNNAGIGYSSSDKYNMGGFLDTSLKEWNDVLAINLNSVFLVTKEVLPIMLKQGSGSIINNSSMNGIIGVPGADAYTAAKGGSVALTRVWALNYGPKGVRVNCICPGGIDTPMIAPAKSLPGFSDGFKNYPIPRLGQPEEVAYAALFLASDESSYITGLILPVDGGWYAM